jgi:hypothetical protein
MAEGRRLAVIIWLGRIFAWQMGTMRGWMGSPAKVYRNIIGIIVSAM